MGSFVLTLILTQQMSANYDSQAVAGSGSSPSGFIQMADLRGRLTQKAQTSTSSPQSAAADPSQRTPGPPPTAPLFLSPDTVGNWFYATRARKIDARSAKLGKGGPCGGDGDLNPLCGGGVRQCARQHLMQLIAIVNPSLTSSNSPSKPTLTLASTILTQHASLL